MILFTIAETLNKFIGIFVVAIIARSMSVSEFAELSILLIIFGYFLELSFYSYQNKNLYEYNKCKESYLSQQQFLVRQKIVIIFSILSFLIFNIYSFNYLELNAFPLSFVLLLPFLSLDFSLYANGKGNTIIICRFISQLVFLASLLYASKLDILKSDNVTYFYLLNSSVLTFLVFFSVLQLRYIGFKIFCSNVLTTLRLKINLASEIKNQMPVFLSKIIILVIITIEMPLLSLFGNESIKDLSISHRISLIILPFIVFYLSSNAASINESDLRKKLIVTSVLSCLTVIASPVIVKVLFGDQFVKESLKYALFYFIIPFQTFLNYAFFMSIKNGKESKFTEKLVLFFVFYIFSVFALGSFYEFSFESLIALVAIKCFVCVFLMSFISFFTRATTVFLISIPIFISIICLNYDLFKRYNDAGVDFINFIMSKF